MFGERGFASFRGPPRVTEFDEPEADGLDKVAWLWLWARAMSDKMYGHDQPDSQVNACLRKTVV
jgi:hypothetical protein